MSGKLSVNYLYYAFLYKGDTIVCWSHSVLKHNLAQSLIKKYCIHIKYYLIKC